MNEENLKHRLFKLKDLRESSRSIFLKSALKKSTSQSLDGREKGKENLHRELSKGKEPLQWACNKYVVRSNIGKIVVQADKALIKGNGKNQVENNGGQPIVKEDASVLVKDEAKLLVKQSSKVFSKEHEKVNGKEQGKSKEVETMNGKDSGGVRDLIKVKDEDKDLKRGREKGKGFVLKLSKASKVTSKATKNTLSSTNTKASSSLGQSLKKTGQKHDPPEDKDPLRIFYSTLREQMPESEMAEFWMMEYGLLTQEEAEEAFKRKRRRGLSYKHDTPSKSSTSSRLSNGSLAMKRSTHFSNSKRKDVETSSKGKNKRVDSESDSDDFLLKTRMKKKLKV